MTYEQEKLLSKREFYGYLEITGLFFLATVLTIKQVLHL